MVNRIYTITYKNRMVETITQLARIEDHEEIAKVIEECMKHDKPGTFRLGNPGYAIFIRMSEIIRIKIGLVEELEEKVEDEIKDSNKGEVH